MPHKAVPQLVTEEPLCEPGKLACGNGQCLEKILFCNGIPDCTDESDENACSEFVAGRASYYTDCVLISCRRRSERSAVVRSVEVCVARMLLLAGWNANSEPLGAELRAANDLDVI